MGVVLVEELVSHIATILGHSSDAVDLKYHESVGLFVASHVTDALVAISTHHQVIITTDLESAIADHTPEKLAVIMKLKLPVSAIDQLECLVLPFNSEDNEMFNKLRSIVNLALIPVFDTLSLGRNSQDSFMSATRKKFSELSSYLQNLQEKIHVPDLLLSVHPQIKQFDTEQDSFSEDLLNDSSLLNEVTSIVNGWTRLIQSITSLSSDIDSQSSVLEELQFWNSLDISLSALEEQLESVEVKNSISLLNRANRFHVTLSFTNDTHIAAKRLEAKTNLLLLKDLPLSEMLDISSKDPECLNIFNDLVAAVFNHLKRLRTISNFPLQRALLLIELILKDVVAKLCKLLNGVNLMAMDFDQFLVTYNTLIANILSTIDLNVKYMINLVRELLRKRQDKFFIVRINQDLVDQVRERLEFLNAFRALHESIIYITRNFLRDSDQEPKLTDEYNRLVLLDAFGFSKHGSLNWSSSQKLYEQAYSLVQSLVVLKLNGLFAGCQAFKDYVTVIEKYKYLEAENTFDFLALMKEELRLQILEAARNEITSIVKFETSNRNKLVPQLSNFIHGYRGEKSLVVAEFLKALSLREKLSFYELNLALLVGKDWNKYSIGSKLKDQISSFISSTNPEEIFKQFLITIQEFIESNKIEVKGKVLRKVMKDQQSDIILNFNFDVIEVKNSLLFFQSLGFKIPVATLLEFQKLNKLLPIINDLHENIMTAKRILSITLNKECYKDFHSLIEMDKEKSYEYFLSLSEINWEYLAQAIDSVDQDPRLIEVKAYNTVIEFQNFITQWSSKLNSIERLHSFLSNTIYYELRLCDYNYESLKNTLELLSSSIPEFYSQNGTDTISEKVNEELTNLINLRCQEALEDFTEKVSQSGNTLKPNFDVFITFQNQIMKMEPSTDELKSILINEVNEIIAVAEKQQLLSNQKLTINSLILSLLIAKAFRQLESLLLKIQLYYSDWCDICTFIKIDFENPEDVAQIAPPDSLDDWQRSMSEVSKLNNLFDNESLVFGNFVIFLEGVQSKTFSKFESFKRSATKVFADVYDSSATAFDKDLSLTIRSLNFNMMDTKNFLDNLIKFITVKKLIETELKPKHSTLIVCSKLLQRFNYKFPVKWIYPEQIENRISVLESIVEKKEAVIEENFEFIKSKFVGGANELAENILKFKDEWFAKKPISGDMNPIIVLNSLANFTDKCNNYLKQKEDIISISQSLNFKVPDVDTEILRDIHKEASDFKHVWSSINSLHGLIQEMRELKWSDIKVREIRSKLDNLLEECRLLPIKIRQYAAFDDVQQTLKDLIKQQKHLNDLKNPNFKERHWKKFITKIGYRGKNFQLFTLGDVWNLKLSTHEAVIQSIVLQANNEHTLEENIEKIKEKWGQMAFEYFNYNSRFKLIKSWGIIFDACTQDLNELSSMRNSASFSAFEQDVIQLENKLHSFYVILDTWIEVQRQWVYLDGIFGSKNNISNILPVESARFNNLTHNLFDLMKKTYKLELAIDVLLVTDFGENLEKLLDSFSKLRRSLSDFLEKQRDNFARFYFIGNEDLLELIGAGFDFTKINVHISKLFSGVAAINFDKDSSSIVSVASSQSEVLKLQQPVSLIKYPSLVEWLTQLELELKLSLASLVKLNLDTIKAIYASPEIEKISKIAEDVPCQVILLCCQIVFTEFIESDNLESINVPKLIELFTEVSLTSDSVKLLKVQNLLIELIHQNNVVDKIRLKQQDKSVLLASEFLFHFYPHEADILKSLKVNHFANEFDYGFEYLGVTQRMVYTPLISNCYLAMTQALGQKLGGSPFGPAGTGKTESIKALGEILGRMVAVFNCDDTFDFQAMSRIFFGICKVGCWGCFDEFNRLDEKLLSAVSSQIEAIEVGLKNQSTLIELSGKNLYINPKTGIFVTMNPGYAGRNELPENLKKLFRSFSMERPDKEIIVDVLLASQGFKDAKKLSDLIVPFFNDLEKSASIQPHYDFGLRSLKAVLNQCGKLKRLVGSSVLELLIILRSINESILPKLIRDDEKAFEALKIKYFPKILSDDFEDDKLVNTIRKVGEQKGLNVSGAWYKKLLQLNQLSANHHGLIMVGESGSGKTTCWELLLESIKESTGQDYVSYRIDAKVLTKDTLYGSLDLVTREWSDGLFTGILRKIKANLRGEMNKLSWIIFDCDIDPEWAENLNSVLDDNKVLTLPNGERIDLPNNVRIIFETHNLKSTTLATISRCGMIWFDSEIIDFYSIFSNQLYSFSNNVITVDDVDVDEAQILSRQKLIESRIKLTITQDILQVFLLESEKYEHIMDSNNHRYITSFTNFLKAYSRKLLEYSFAYNTDIEQYTQFIDKACLLSAIWSFAGDSSIEERQAYGSSISKLPVFQPLNIDEGHLVEYDIAVPNGEWVPWSSKITFTELEPHQIADPNTVVQTTDTLRHESLIHSVLNEHKTLLLCGPPGSGKTMTFLEVLKRNSNLDILQLNFSKESSPESLMRSLKQHCEFQRTSNGIIFTPKVSGKWVVVFCDEINLPGVDKYGCQRVLSLMRQMIEHNGFWDPNEMQWVEMRNIQFVGACNSPKDPGRQKLSERFARHVVIIMVDYPGETALHQIYETFNLAVMKCAPDLRGYTKSITKAMIDVYLQSKEKLKPELQAHYIYSPRELSRWSRGLLEGLKANTYTALPEFLRLWYHEGLRLFYDRLVSEEEREWTHELFDRVIKDSFPFAETTAIMKEPVLFSDWLSENYESVDKNELHKFLGHRLTTFSEEEFDIDLILYEDFLTHALRIDRVLRQPQGHMILVGPPTSGKTTLAKFVAWINGLKSVLLNVHSNYGIDEFDKALRDILLRCARGERICYIIDEASIIETSFIERMNTLLANSEIPGLFDGDDFKNLMNICLEESQAQGLLLDSDEELYKWFSQQISLNLHVVFTLVELGKSNRLHVVSSPALFNRCVLSYMGDWSSETLIEVASKRIETIPVDINSFEIPESYVPYIPRSINSIRDALIDSFIFIHASVGGDKLMRSYNRYPSQFISLIDRFIDMFSTKQYELEELQRHTTGGLNKLRETVLQVSQLNEELSKKQKELTLKDNEAREMLNTMLSEQNEAERKQEFSISAQEELNKQEIEIQKRRDIAMKDLEEAEPAILEARRGVQNIKKQHLTEIRSMANPPAAVKMTMESVCTLIGYEVTTWRDVQLAIRKDDFIPSIVNYNNEEQLSSKMRQHMEKTYLSRPDYTFEVVNRASKACGPLIQWVRAQLTYLSALERIGPLKEEVEILEIGAKKTRAQLFALQEMVGELETSIEKYKNDYSSLIRETESIKMEMETVSKKVEKCTELMDSLTSEKDRWKRSTQGFSQENERVIGNAVLASAFLIYCGGFDQKDREYLMSLWKKQLDNINIKYDSVISVLNLMPASFNNFKTLNDLSMDSLITDNIAIINNCQIPLIIDPSLETSDIIRGLIPEKNLVITSFSNESFIRDLENSIRFGGCLLINDFEHYDPILDPVLRCEIIRNGGRRMIRIGNQQIDYDEKFSLFLHTRDPFVQLPAFVESRVTVVNFSITSRSVESQILNLSLKHTEPETESKRSQLISLQSEYRTKLKELEKELLDSLAEAEGSILDDDKIIETLETLKSESKLIDDQIKDSKSVLEKIDEVRNKFFDVASHCALIFELLKSFSGLSTFYQFLLDTFRKVFVNVLMGESSSDLSSLILELYKEVFAIFSPSLLAEDKVVLALGLMMIYYDKEIGTHFSSFCKELLASTTGDKNKNIVLLLKSILVDAEGKSIDQVLEENSDNEVLSKLSPILLSIKDFDRNPSKFSNSLSSVCSVLFTGIGEYSSKYAIDYFVESTSKPILLSSAEGYDATFKVEQLATVVGKRLEIISLGSREGVESARKELQSIAAKGNWLLIQNIQMSPEWLSNLEMILRSLSYDKTFKVFLTCNLNSNIPLTLVDTSQVLVYQSQLGIKQIMTESFSFYGENILNDKPTEYRYIYFLLAWYHSIILARLNYVPVSFKKGYDINDSDLSAAIKSINGILKPLMRGDVRNISLDSIPFEKISLIVGEITYGGKIDDIEDSKYFEDLARYLFKITSFNDDFTLIPDIALTRRPDGIKTETYKEWINDLPDQAPLQWLGLDENADDYMTIKEIKQTCYKVIQLL